MPRTNKILIRSGTTTPSASDFAVGEPAFDKSAGKLYIKNAAGNMVELGTGGGGGGGSGSVDVYEFATTANFPATGASAVIYIATDTGKTYRWAGNVYMELGQIGGAGGALSASVTIPGLGDASYSSVALLLHGEGTNGSTTVTDNSVSPKTITVSGSAQISTAQSKFGSSSIYLPASSSISTPSSSDFAFGTGDFTVEFWWYVTTLPTSEARLVNFGGAANNYLNLTYGFSSNTFTIVNESVAHILLSTQAVSLNQWHHIAYTRASGTVYLFFNGALLGTVGANGVSTPATSVLFSSGPGGSSYFDEIRITNGVARYTSAFTPPSAVFPDTSSLTLPVSVSGTGSGLSLVSAPASVTSTGTAGQIAYDGNYLYIATGTNMWERAAISTWDYDQYGANVVLLLHANGSFADASSYARSVTAWGEANANGTALYGSGAFSFNGSGDYLTTASTASLDLGSNYTLECWLYPNNSTLSGGIFHRGKYFTASTSWDGLTASIRAIGNAVRFYFWATLNTNEQYVDIPQSYFPANTWTHLAMVRSGASGYVFAGGQLVGTISNLNTPVTSTYPLYIGTWPYNVEGSDTFAGYWSGKIDEVRITTAARYTSAFTPPTAAFPNP